MKRGLALLAGAFLIAAVASAAPVTLKIMHWQPQFTDQFKAMGAAFTKQFPDITIDFEIQSADYNTILKTRLNSGDIPDVFMYNPYSGNKVIAEYALDLSNEPFIKNIYESVLFGSTYQGKVIGTPTLLEAFSFIYNKDMFQKVGVKTLPRTLSGLEEVCKKLQAAGITPFSNGYKEWWLFQHIWSDVLAAENTDFNRTIADLNAGKSFGSLRTMSKMFDLVDLTVKYGAPKPLETGWEEEEAALANGKVAMIHMGTWAETNILKTNPNLKMGFLPAPVGEDPAMARLMIDTAYHWVVYKDGKNVDAAKKWLNWLITSDYGRTFGPKELKETSAVKGAPTADAQLTKEAAAFLAKKETAPWIFNLWPEGFAEQEGIIFQAYAGKAKTRQQAIAELDQNWKKLSQAAN